MHTLGCFDDGVDDDDDALLGDPESFRLFLSFTGESGPFSTLGGEFASCNQLAKPVLISQFHQDRKKPLFKAVFVFVFFAFKKMTFEYVANIYQSTRTSNYTKKLKNIRVSAIKPHPTNGTPTSLETSTTRSPSLFSASLS